MINHEFALRGTKGLFRLICSHRNSNSPGMFPTDGASSAPSASNSIRGQGCFYIVYSGETRSTAQSRSVGEPPGMSVLQLRISFSGRWTDPPFPGGLQPQATSQRQPCKSSCGRKCLCTHAPPFCLSAPVIYSAFWRSRFSLAVLSSEAPSSGDPQIRSSSPAVPEVLGADLDP